MDNSNLLTGKPTMTTVEFTSGDQLLLKNQPDYFQKIFDKCDINKDGNISLSELRQFIECETEVPDTVLKKICKFADKNNDGRIDFCEFVEMVNHPQYKHFFERYANRYVSIIVAPFPKLFRQQTLTGLYEDECKCKVYTINMLLLSIIQIIFYYIDQSTIIGKNRGVLTQALLYDSDRKREIWRFFTCMFVHSNEMHLYSNIAIQLIIGIPLEMVHKWRVLVIYLVGIFSGSLATCAFYPTDDLLGASAGAYSFYSAHIATVLMNWREMSYPFAQLFIFGLLVIMDPVYCFINFGNEGSVSYIAHLAGAIAGLLIGVNILRNLNVTKTERVIWWICNITFIALFSTCLILLFIRQNSKTSS